MRACDCMSHELKTVDADLPVELAAETMRASNLGALPVVSCGRLVGMLTDRDITVRLTAHHGDPSRTLVRQIMTPGVVTCFDGETLESAAAAMAAAGVRRIVVLDRDSKPVGLLSIVDLALRAEDPRWLASILARIASAGAAIQEESPFP